MTREDILQKLADNRETIRHYGVRRLGLFGSSARGGNRADSDVDIIVEFDTTTFDAYMDLKAYLEGLLGHSIDLVPADSIKPRLRPLILNEAVYAPGL